MPLAIQNTTLAGAPYFDDFSNAEANNYHRVLFKPSVAVQARELNQLQAMLQSQVERFGDGVYRRGTILRGCNITFDSYYNYVKLTDQQLNGTSVDVEAFANCLLISTSGLESVVVNQAGGLTALAPDLNTLYVKYINTGTSTYTNGEPFDVKSYSANNTLTAYNRIRTVESIQVVAGGVGYSNTDTIEFVANNDSGAGAKATLTTHANGTVRTVTVTSKGTGYVNPPTVLINTTTGIDAQLTAINYLGQLVVANSSFDPVGVSYAATVSDGTIFQKGHFLNVTPQTLVVSKYGSIADGQPNNAFVGFSTTEAVINSYSDDTLLDNSAGSTNEMAPGADRLQLTPRLVVLTPDEARADTEFLTLVEFQNGYPVRTQLDTVHNSFSTEAAKRTAEESGDYVVTPFGVYAEEKFDLVGGAMVSNTTHLNAVVTPGVGYVNGIRTEIFNNYRFPMRKSTDTQLIESQYISTNFGNFVYVNNLAGSGFNPVSSANVVIYSTAMQAANSTNYGANIPTGTGSIGTARLRGLEYDSGTPGTPQGQYRMYLYDVKMNPGKSFESARAIGISSLAAADIVTSGNTTVQKAKLYDVNKDGLVFPVGAGALKSTNNATLVYRTVNTGVTFASTGNVQITFSSSDTTFPYTPGTTLSTTEENDFIFIPTSNTQSTNVAGWSAAATLGSNTVTGTGTTFTTTFSVGDFIALANTTATVVKRITQIESNLKLYTDTNYATAMTGNVAIYFPKYQPINLLSRTAANIRVNSANTVTADLGLTYIGVTLASPMPVTAYYNAKVANPPLRTKKLQKDVLVKVSTAATTTKPNGPWCLGIPDTHKITGVYIGSANNYAANTTNYVSQFELDNGQRDNLYGLSYLKKKPGSTVNTTGASLVVKLDTYYGHSDVTGGAYFAGPASYPIDDVNQSANTIAITTEEIEVFVSNRDGAVYDLRNSIDFRPLVANTANAVAISLSGATIDPAVTEAIAVSPNYFPSPTKYLIADLEVYQARVDKVVLGAQFDPLNGGSLTFIEGKPSLNPQEPNTPPNSMLLATVNVPPYPSLDPISASAVSRTDLAVKASVARQQKRYTMKEIGNFDKRIERLEYYSLLNRLESKTKDSTQNQTALNGFLVDSFENFDVSNLADSEFSAFVDTKNGVLRPRVRAEDVDLKFDTSIGSETTNVRGHSELVTLPYTHKTLLSQSYGTNERNLAGELWRFKGQLFLYPKFDGQYDKDLAPVNVTIDLAAAQNEVIDAVNAAFKLMDGKTTVQSLKQIGSSISTTTVSGSTATQTTMTAYDQMGIIEKANITGGPVTNTLEGSFSSVSSVQFKPYMRANPITFLATGLRPNTRHYIYFDDVDVNAHTIPAKYIGNGGTVDTATVVPTGIKGGELRTDALGQLAGVFSIPADTFYVGERKIKIIDVSNIGSEEASISFTNAKYVAYNLDVDNQQVTISTKKLESVDTKLYTAFTGKVGTTVLTTTSSWTIPSCGGDPVAQTFKVPDALKTSTEGVYITKLDLYFATKSVSNDKGVTIQIRSTVNGYPGQQLIPFSRKWLPTELINATDDASLPTTFVFDSPVFLKSGEEYCIVVIPDGLCPDFYVWTGEAGNPDVTNPNLVAKNDWGTGQMFTSVNNTAWNPHSFEDLKFTMYQADFTGSTTGAASFTHDNYEFLTLSNPTGAFDRGDVVAQKGTSYLAGILDTTAANATNDFIVSGTNTSFTSTLNTGDSLLLTYGLDPSANLTGTVKATTTAANLVGVGTNFTSELSIGDHVLVSNHVRQVINISNTTNITLDAPVTAAVTTAVEFQKLNSVVYDIVKVASITSDSQIKISKGPKFSQINPVPVANTLSTVNYMKVITGEVDRYRINDQKLYLKKSTASDSTNKFVKSQYTLLNADSGRSIVCALGSGVANVASIDNLTYQYVEPKIETMAPQGTSLTRTYKTVKPDDTILNATTGEDAGPTALPFTSVLKSRSNEINGSSVVTSFKMSENLQTGVSLASPAVDISPISLELIANQIDNYTTFRQLATYGISSTAIAIADGTRVVAGMGIRGLGIPTDAVVTAVNGNVATISKPTTGGVAVETFVEFHPNETQRFGVSKNKYISKYIELADQYEAEDLKVYITAYRPLGTDVDVYTRVIHEGDAEVASNKEWTLLEKTAATASLYGNPGNSGDFKEYVYVLPKTLPSLKMTGKANTSTGSATVIMDSTARVDSELVVGDLVKLVKADSTAANGTLVVASNDDYDIRTVTAVSNSSQFVVDSAPSFTLAGATIEKVTQPRGSFRYNRTSPGYISVYHGAASDGSLTAQYTGYKYLAVKIVLRADNEITIPAVSDMRAIAVMI